MCWLVVAGVLTVVSMRFPWAGWSVGLILGGARSHAVETTRYGHVCDYICLRIWPAFNLADVALRRVPAD
jgi:signal peptidase II